MKNIIKTLIGIYLLGILGSAVGAETAPSTLMIDAKAPSIEVSDTLYGLFYEDINFAADGGLYADQVFNRSFEYRNLLAENEADGLTGWQINLKDFKYGKVQLDQSHPLNENNPTSLKVEVNEPGFKIRNMGHAANLSASSAEMSIFEGESYQLSFYLLNQSYQGELQFFLEDADGNLISDVIKIKVKSSDDWTKIENLLLHATHTLGGRLVIEVLGSGTFNLDMVSLMPTQYHGAGRSEWKYGGLRLDLVQALADLNPQFLRFPGGCIAEGAFDKDNHYNWKDTIGPLEERKENWNLWGYMQSYGLGYHEYFQLAEDLGATPIPVVHAGILCQVRSGDLQPMLPPTDEFKQLTQDILDLIEYANGDESTEWGSRRAENGHKEPFNLKYIAIGNENWGERYFNNFKVLKAAIEAVYPDVTVITTSGALSEGPGFDYAWDMVHKRYPDTYVDEHYYNSPEWFLENTDRYDSYRRDSAKVFVGEFAAHAEITANGRPNTLYTALCEAAYLTGIERNSDVVKMISYAPLLAKVGSTQWTPDLIWFDSHKVMLTPNYYTFQLFSKYIGTRYVESELKSGLSLYHSVTVDDEAEEVYIKVVNPSDEKTTLHISLTEFEQLKENAEVVVIAHENPQAQNTMNQPDVITSQLEIVSVEENQVSVDIEANSVTLVRLGYGNSLFEAGVLKAWEVESSTRLIVPLILASGVIITIGMTTIYLKVKK